MVAGAREVDCAGTGLDGWEAHACEKLGGRRGRRCAVGGWPPTAALQALFAAHNSSNGPRSRRRWFWRCQACGSVPRKHATVRGSLRTRTLPLSHAQMIPPPASSRRMRCVLCHPWRQLRAAHQPRRHPRRSALRCAPRWAPTSPPWRCWATRRRCGEIRRLRGIARAIAITACAAGRRWHQLQAARQGERHSRVHGPHPPLVGCARATGGPGRR